MLHGQWRLQAPSPIGASASSITSPWAHMVDLEPITVQSSKNPNPRVHRFHQATAAIPASRVRAAPLPSAPLRRVPAFLPVAAAREGAFTHYKAGMAAVDIHGWGASLVRTPGCPAPRGRGRMRSPPCLPRSDGTSMSLPNITYNVASLSMRIYKSRCCVWLFPAPAEFSVLPHPWLSTKCGDAFSQPVGSKTRTSKETPQYLMSR
ncbi:hypothetical protein ABZP36_018947 [Zizania latifolia]